eukprot:1291767-Pyramimonas_sp.AAC.1
MLGDFNFSDNPNESLLRPLARDAPRDHGHLFRPSDAGRANHSEPFWRQLITSSDKMAEIVTP